MTLTCCGDQIAKCKDRSYQAPLTRSLACPAEHCCRRDGAHCSRAALQIPVSLLCFSPMEWGLQLRWKGQGIWDYGNRWQIIAWYRHSFPSSHIPYLHKAFKIPSFFSVLLWNIVCSVYWQKSNHSNRTLEENLIILIYYIRIFIISQKIQRLSHSYSYSFLSVLNSIPFHSGTSLLSMLQLNRRPERSQVNLLPWRYSSSWAIILTEP